MLIRRCEIDGRAPLDVRIAGDRIAEIADRIEPLAGEPVIDAAGGALLPGLHDHHIHLFALAAALRSVPCGPPSIRRLDELARALADHRVADDEWLRGVGYHESVAGDLDRVVLDRLVSDRPLRVQHRSGAAWFLNSRAIELLGLDGAVDAPGVERVADGRATGRLFRCDKLLRESVTGEPAPHLGSGVAASRELRRHRRDRRDRDQRQAGASLADRRKRCRRSPPTRRRHGRAFRSRRPVTIR